MPNTTQMIETAMGPTKVVLGQHERWLQELRFTTIPLILRELDAVKEENKELRKLVDPLYHRNIP